ncbi:MAG: alpha/beta hydrolase, partial [Bdellovibrionales bacterium]|nr:alpha/beta hydrolase [Bdellovibrionales bacterium]
KIESELRFDDYVQDAQDWITLLKKDKRFPNITIIGHSEGSLVGMIASRDASQFISIAGVGQSADKTLKEQLSAQPKEMKDMCFPIIDSLKQGKLVENVNPVLNSLFRPSVQPYLISWFKYDPQVEIKKLSIPTLIIQGTNDIQVTVNDAKNLSIAIPKAQLVLIEKMNHIFRIVEGDRQVNIETYNNALLPISDKMITEIMKFILNH